ncbi:ABC transporter permease [Phenylobacterium sp.]|uniref:ABC transporter permease n=1 Tax=Phenylobacterium sp. TaxID=1871053 RepID=UPI002E31544C|nr:ABC transporter permease [Phenylobacterium sp.]HEX4709358.1 ABC transporter permease [Phenylobacterium sp.]
MNLLILVWAFIRRRPLTWGFNVLTLSTGVAVVLALALVNQAIEDRFQRDLAGIDLVIGAKGSPLQIVLSAVFQMDTPTGNISLEDARRFAGNAMAASAVPVSMGDNVRNARIVGTTLDYPRLYGARLAQGRWWSQPMEAVLGAGAARRLGLKPGDTFVGAHGLVGSADLHKRFPYRVVGVLRPTGSVVDRIVLTDLASVWNIHEHPDPDEAAADPNHREVTALLVKYRSAMGALMMPRLVSATPNLQPAIPAIESARLFNLLGVGADVLQGVGLSILALAGIGFFIALFGAVSQRRRDLALIRALGARPSLLLLIVALEAALLGLAGGVVGVAGGRALAAYAGRISMAAASGPTLMPSSIGLIDLIAVGAALVLSLAASIGPAIIASRTDPARELAGG